MREIVILNEEPRRHHAENFIDHNKLWIMQIVTALDDVSNKRRDDSHDHNKRNEENVRRVEFTEQI